MKTTVKNFARNDNKFYDICDGLNYFLFSEVYWFRTIQFDICPLFYFFFISFSPFFLFIYWCYSYLFHYFFLQEKHVFSHNMDIFFSINKVHITMRRILKCINMSEICLYISLFVDLCVNRNKKINLLVSVSHIK